MWVFLLILKIILYLLAALLGILITLLIVPFSYQGEAEVYEGVSFSYKLGWFWNLFNVRGTKGMEVETTAVYLGNVRLFAVKTREKKEPKPEEEKEEEEEAVEEAKKENSLKSMIDTKLIKEGFAYLKKLVMQIKPKQMHLQGVYGFDDPSLTGMTAGFLYTLQGVWPQSKIQMQPNFMEEVLELELKAAGNLQAGRVLWDTARFLLKKDVRTKIFKKKKKVETKSKK